LGDAEREALHHGRGHVLHVFPGPDQGERDKHQARHQPHGQHPGRAVLRDDRHEHHGHRARRPGHLQIRTAEHRGERTGDDRGRQPRLGAEPGGDAESEREWQRDDRHREAGQQVPARIPAHLRQITTAGQQRG
jgi:hypothetical protein